MCISKLMTIVCKVQTPVQKYKNSFVVQSSITTNDLKSSNINVPKC